MEAAITAEALGVGEGLSLREIMARVKFSVEQMSRICGVSRRQLSYWTKKGILVSEDGHTLATLEKVLLIKQELDNKTSLRRAVQKVEAYLESRAAESARLEAMPQAELRALVMERLEQLQGLVHVARELMPQAAARGAVLRLATELEALQLDSLLRPPAAEITLPSMAAHLNLARDRLGMTLAYLQDGSTAKA